MPTDITVFGIEHPDSAKEASMVTWLDDCFKAADQVRQRHEVDWFLNACYLEGNQWEAALYNDVRRFRTIQLPPQNTKVKIVSNQILPLTRQAVAALRANVAEQVAIPATSDQADVWAAEISTDFLKFKETDDNEAQLRFNEIMGALIFGRMLRKVLWDPDLASTAPDGRIVPGMGEIENTTLDPSEFLLCPWDKGSVDPTWVILCDITDVDEINDTYPGHNVTAEEVSGLSFTPGKVAGRVMYQTENIPSPKRAALLKRMYVKPSKKFPKGLYLVWSNKKFLHGATLPGGIMPFVPIDWLQTPTRVYPIEFITPLRDPQREINTTLSQLIELKNAQLRGDVLIQGIGNVTVERQANGTRIIRLDPQIQEYQLMKYELNATEAENLLGRLAQDMMQTSGIHETTMGQAPPRAVTATQTQMLKESDFAGLTLFRAGMDISYCRIASLKIKNAHDHYHLPRLLRYVGASDKVQAQAFYGSDLGATKDVIPRSTPIVTETVNIQMRQEAASRGLFGPYLDDEDRLCKIDALLDSGIRNIRQEIDEKLFPLTLDQLRQIVGELRMKKTEANFLMADVGIAQLQLQKAQLEAMLQGPGQTAIDQNGEPARPTPEEETANQALMPPMQPQGQQALPA